MGNEINKPPRAFDSLIRRMDRERADKARTRVPRGFWTKIVYDYIANNPGCSRSDAAKSITPLRSLTLGYSIIKRLISKEWIRIDQGKQLFVVDKSKIINMDSW